MPRSSYAIGFVTASSMMEAEKIASGIVESGLAACCNIVPHIHSIYTWKGKVEKNAESLIIIKTRKSLRGKLVEKVKSLHSYEVPEVIFIDIENGSPDYLKWIGESTVKK